MKYYWGSLCLKYVIKSVVCDQLPPLRCFNVYGRANPLAVLNACTDLYCSITVLTFTSN